MDTPTTAPPNPAPHTGPGAADPAADPAKDPVAGTVRRDRGAGLAFALAAAVCFGAAGPFGKALIGAQEGDEVTVEAPMGALVYRVKKIER